MTRSAKSALIVETAIRTPSSQPGRNCPDSSTRKPNVKTMEVAVMATPVPTRLRRTASDGPREAAVSSR